MVTQNDTFQRNCLASRQSILSQKELGRSLNAYKFKPQRQFTERNKELVTLSKQLPGFNKMVQTYTAVKNGQMSRDSL